MPTGTAQPEFLAIYLPYGTTTGYFVLDGKAGGDYVYATYPARDDSGEYFSSGTLIGGNGNDHLVGEHVAADVHGDAGGDRVDWYFAPASIDTGAGDDAIFYTGAGMAFSVNAGTGDDFVIASDAGGSTSIDMGAGNDLVRLLIGSANVRTGTGNDRVEIDWQTAGATVDTGVGDDFVRVNGPGRTTIDAGAGNDRIFANSGGGRIDAGSGLDKVYVEAGTHVVTLGGAPDTLYMRGGIADVLDFRTGNSGDTLVLEDIFTQYDPLPVPRQQLGALGYLRIVQDGADTVVQADLDGAAGTAYGWQEYVRLENVRASDLNAHNLDGLML